MFNCCPIHQIPTCLKTPHNPLSRLPDCRIPANASTIVGANLNCIMQRLNAFGGNQAVILSVYARLAFYHNLVDGVNAHPVDIYSALFTLRTLILTAAAL